MLVDEPKSQATARLVQGPEYLKLCSGTYYTLKKFVIKDHSGILHNPSQESVLRREVPNRMPSSECQLLGWSFGEGLRA